MIIIRNQKCICISLFLLNNPFWERIHFSNLRRKTIHLKTWSTQTLINIYIHATLHITFYITLANKPQHWLPSFIQNDHLICHYYCFRWSLYITSISLLLFLYYFSFSPSRSLFLLVSSRSLFMLLSISFNPFDCNIWTSNCSDDTWTHDWLIKHSIM